VRRNVRQHLARLDLERGVDELLAAGIDRQLA
jgi:hypothetical protein